MSTYDKIDNTQPYIERIETIRHKIYNPHYGDKRVCECSHMYERHFDSYNQMANVGCKYCGCNYFVERKVKSN